MGGKTKEDMELLNKRASQFDYSQVNREAEDDFYRGIELRKGKKHVGLGKQ